MNEQELKDDLIEDLVAIMTSFTARIYGKRAAALRVQAAKRALEND